MKGISPENQERIRRVLNGSFWNDIFLVGPERVKLLQEIGFSKEIAAIPEILCLLADTHGLVWRATSEALHRLVETLSPLELAWLDHRVREVGACDWESGRRWSNLKPSRVSRFAESDFAASLCGLASFHANGHVREAAVDALCQLRDGSELPFLLIRTNDWVPAVRECALAGVRKRLVPEYSMHWLKNLRLVQRIQARGRVDKGIVEAICDLLRSPECREALQVGMSSQDRVLRRASFQLAARGDDLGQNSIVRAAMSDPDPVVRAWAVRRFLPEVSDTQLPQVVGSLLKDRFRPVRQDALWTLASRLPNFAAEPLRLALLDSSAGVREIARHFLEKSGFETGPYYLAVIQAGNSHGLPVAIRGLGEAGKKTDAQLIRPFLQASVPRLRKAAVYALGRLDAESFLPEFLAALADTHPGVSREAVKSCLPKVRLLELDPLWTLFQRDSRLFVRKHALMLLQRFGKWERLAPLLWACCDSEQMISELAKAGIREWIFNYNSSFAEPNAGQIQQIRQALKTCSGILDKGITMELSSCVSTFEK